MDPMNHDASLIVFFDLETTLPPHRTIIEFGAILVCPRKLVEKFSYSTFVRPNDLSIITRAFETKGITRDLVSNAPSFSAIAHYVFNLLDGRTWAGHNIEEFDNARIKEAFRKIGWQPPEPKGTIDTLPLLYETFGKRAGNMKLATLASYFGLPQQTHRSLDDARLALQVLKNCGAVLFLESTFPDVLTNESWFSPEYVSIPSINASLSPFYRGSPKIQLFHSDVKLKLQCTRLNVRCGPRPYSPLTFVVDAPESLYKVLDCCNHQACSLFEQSGSTSDWKEVIKNYGGRDTVRLRIRRYETEICLNKRNGIERQLHIGADEEVADLFRAGTLIDALFLVDTYDYKENAGIGLVAEKLIIRS